MTAQTRVFHSGALRTIKSAYVMQAGILRRIKTIKVQDGGSLRTVAIFADPLTVSISSSVSETAYRFDAGGFPIAYTRTYSASAIPSGGFSPFTYSWAIISGTGWTMSGSTAASIMITGHSDTTTAGVARVTVTDSAGQTATADLSIV